MASSPLQLKDAMLPECVSAEEPGDSELLLDLLGPAPLLTSTSTSISILAGPGGEEAEPEDGGRSADGELQGCEQLEQRWILWHEFMKEHAQLDAWLRAAERALGSSSCEHVAYVTAREQLRRFERLQREARSHLVQVDRLTQRNRTLTRWFRGAMQARLLTSARECSLRWDEVNAKLESVTARLKLFVVEWEEFETEREELALWLSDLDVRLTEVEHLTESTCEKLRRLQSFQECVCVNSGRINALLQRGEALIQRSGPADAQHLEARLLELLRCCSHVYNNIARTHTRLLSMRLVFEDDWILSQAPDSGCPSESLLEEEAAHEKLGADPPAISDHRTDSPVFPRPPSPSHPSHEHLGLEWDPSVDVGRSVSRDDADSSYFSASTGFCHRDAPKRWSYLSSLGSQSDISNDVAHQEAEDAQPEEWTPLAPLALSPITPGEGNAGPSQGQWEVSTPDQQDGEPVVFDGGRVREWLGVQSSAPPYRSASCCKAVQTEGQLKLCSGGGHVPQPHQLQPYVTDSQSCHDDAPTPPLPRSSSPLRHQSTAPDWTAERHELELQAEEERSGCEEAELQRSRQSVSCLLSPPLLYLLLAAAVALLACLLWDVLEPPCHRSCKVPAGLHMRYVNGPPPT